MAEITGDAGNIVALSPPSGGGGQQLVAPYEARLIARAGQKRDKRAKVAAVTLAGQRARVNRFDTGLERTSADLEQCRGEFRRHGLKEHQPTFESSQFKALIVLLVALETPLSKSALDYLGSSEAESWAIAVFLAAVNFIAAKYTARCLRQSAWGGRGWRDWGIAAATNATLVLALSGLATLRGMAVAESSGASGADAGAALFWFQMFAYIAVVALTYHQTDPDHRAEQLTRQIDKLVRRLDEQLVERETSANLHNTTLAAVLHDLSDIEHDCAERIYEYRDGNLSHRTNAGPEYFRRPITHNLFRPLAHEFGTMIEEHPRTMAKVLAQSAGPGTAEEKAND